MTRRLYSWDLPPHSTGEYDPSTDEPELCNTENSDSQEEDNRLATGRGGRRDHGPSSRRSVSSVLHSSGSSVGEAIWDTLPTGKQDYRRCLFSLARKLKALPHLADADAVSLFPVVAEWHALASAALDGLPLEEVRLDFRLGWTKVKYPAGTGPLAELMARARQTSLPDLGGQHPGLPILAALCRELQRSAGAEPFFLGCRTAGVFIGRDHSTAWRWLQMLLDGKVLALLTVGTLQGRLASQYRYLLPV